MSISNSTFTVGAGPRSGGSRRSVIAGVCVLAALVAGVVLVAVAWVLGGRTGPTAGSSESLLPGEDQGQLNSAGGSPPTVSSVPPAVGTQDSYVLEEGPEILPGARDSMMIHEIPLADLDQLKPSGWNLANLSGFGLAPEHAETGVADGVRTIQLQFVSRDSWVNVAETRSEQDGAELIPLAEKLTQVLDLGAVDHEQRTLSTGDAADLYVSDDDRWTLAVENERVQYVITSNLPQSSAGEMATWVMVTDRSRLQTLPEEPSFAEDRLQRGFDELLPWR